MIVMIVISANVSALNSILFFSDLSKSFLAKLQNIESMNEVRFKYVNFELVRI